MTAALAALASAWRWLAGTQLGRTVALVVGAVAAVLWARWRWRSQGRAEERRRQEREAHEDYRDTRERMDAADGSSGDVDDDRAWLHDRAAKRRRSDGNL